MAEPIYRDLTPEELESFTSQNTQSNSKQQSYRNLTEEELKNIEFKKESVGFGENVYRTVGGALRDTAQATTELIKDVTGADIPDLPTVAEPTYLGGSVLRDIAGFAVPYAGIAKGVSALSKLNKLSKAKKILQPTTTPGRIGKAAVVGATAEQLAFSPNEERLSNLVQEYAPNALSEFLMADEDDTAAEGRLKMALEGVGLGVGLDVAFQGLRGIKNKFKKAEKIEQETGAPIEVEEIKTETSFAQDPNVTKVQTSTYRFDEPVTGEAPATQESFTGNINLEKINADKNVKQKYVEITDENEKFWYERRGKRRFGADGQRLAEDAQALGMTIDDVLNKPRGYAFNAEELTAIRRMDLDYTNELVEASKYIDDKAARGTLTDVDKFEYDLLRQEATALKAKVSGGIAEAGRSLRSLREIVSNPNDKIRNQARKEYMNRIENTDLDPTVVAANMKNFDNVDQAIDYLGKLDKATKLEKVQEFWINSLLSSPSTHLVNITSNELTALMRPAEYFTSALIGAVRGGKDRVTFGEAGARLLGTIYGHMEGLIAGTKALVRPEEILDPATKLELARQKAIGGITGEIVRLPGRALVAEDIFFKTVAYRQEIWGQAFRKAQQEGKGFARASQLVKEHADNPDVLGKDIEAKAMDVGRYQTFTKELGDLGKLVQKGINKAPLARFIAPFVRTPINIVKYAAERTPFGVMSKKFQDEFKKGGATRDEAIGRVALGSGIMTTIGALAAMNHITGRGPSDLNERRALYGTGWRPYSLKIGDAYYGYNRFEPVGILFGVAADVAEISNYINSTTQDEEINLELAKLGSMLGASVATNLTNKTFLSGVTGAIQSLTDPDRYGERFIQRFTGSFVPTGFAYLNQYDDDVLRDARSTTDLILTRLPGAGSKNLPARRDIFGETLTRDEGLVIGPFSPMKVSRDKKDIVFNEFVKIGYNPSVQPRYIRDIELTPKQYENLLKIQKQLRTKQTIEKLIKNSDYLRLPDELKKRTIDTLIQKNRETARNLLFRRDKDLQNKYIEEQRKTIRQLR